MIEHQNSDTDCNAISSGLDGDEDMLNVSPMFGSWKIYILKDPWSQGSIGNQCHIHCNTQTPKLINKILVDNLRCHQR